jgi:hypothetical protein
MPSKLTVSVPEHLSDIAVRIPVDTPDIVGEIILYRESDEQSAESKLVTAARVETVDREEGYALLRGGFRVGNVPNLPQVTLARACDAQDYTLAFRSIRLSRQAKIPYHLRKP